MTTETLGRKTFPKQPKWNSGGALGTLGGLLFGLFVPLNSYSVHWLTTYHDDSVANVLVYGVIGMCVGMVIGVMADRRLAQERSSNRAPSPN